jgi:hypothetical protein
LKIKLKAKAAATQFSAVCLSGFEDFIFCSRV